MNATIQAKDLRAALKAASVVVPRKVTMPVLTGARLVVNQDGVKLYCTDLETTLITSFPGTGKGEAVIEVKTLMTLLPKNNQAEISLYANGKTCRAESGGLAGEISVWSIDEYPALPPQGSVTGAVPLPTETLKTALWFTSADKERLALQHVLIRRKEDTAKIVACNQHILYENTFNGIGTDLNILLPANAARIICNLFAGDILLTAETYGNKRQYRRVKVSQSGSPMELFIRLPDDLSYPEYTCVIPIEQPYSTILDKTVILSLLKGVMPVAKLNSCFRTELVLLETGELRLSSHYGEHKVSFTGVHKPQKTPEKFQVFVNASYLISGLEAIPGASVRLGFETTESQLMLTPTEGESSILVVLMPLRVNE